MHARGAADELEISGRLPNAISAGACVGGGGAVADGFCGAASGAPLAMSQGVEKMEDGRSVCAPLAPCCQKIPSRSAYAPKYTVKFVSVGRAGVDTTAGA